MMSIGVWAVGLGGWGVNGVWLGQRWDVLDDQTGLDQEQVDLKNKIKSTVDTQKHSRLVWEILFSF